MPDSELKFRYLFEKSPIGIALEDLGGKLLFVNPALCSMLGYTVEELTRMNCSQFADPEDEEEDWELFQKLRSNQISNYQIEKRYVRKDGTYCWGRLHVSLLAEGTNGSPLIIALVEDITTRKAAEKVMEKQQLALQALASRLINAHEEERKRIARELHDDIGQRLSLLAMNLGLIVGGLPKERAERAELFRTYAEVSDLVSDVHELSHKLHSSRPQHLGLRLALKELCSQIGNHYKLAVEVRSEELALPIPSETASCLYRVAEEALHNAAKHSGASQVTVTVSKGERSPNGETLLRMEIKDNGRGFDPTLAAKGLGLVSMRERLRMIGGSLHVQSRCGTGTVIAAEAVVEDAAAQRAKAS